MHLNKKSSFPAQLMFKIILYIHFCMRSSHSLLHYITLRYKHLDYDYTLFLRVEYF